MTTKLVGINDFRQNLSIYTKTLKKGNSRLIILKKNEPLLEVKAINKKKYALEKLAEEIKDAREQVKRGEVYTHEEIMKKYGIR